MSILNFKLEQAGMSGVLPRVIYIETDNTIAEVTAAGYLNGLVAQGVSLSEDMMALVSTKASPTAAKEVAWLELSKSGNDWSLVPTASPGSVDLPTTANYLAHFTNTTGNLSSAAGDVINAGAISAGLSGTEGDFKSFPATAARGKFIFKGVANTGDTDVTVSNAAHGQATVVSIPDGGQATTEFIIADSAGTQNITSGNLQVDAGNILAGSDANDGDFVSYPPTTASGTLIVSATDNAGGDFDTTVTNAANVGQDQVVSIPDSGAATANFLLDTGASNLLSKQVFVGIEDIINTTVGTWSIGRNAGGVSGSYAYVKAAASEAPVIGVDLTPVIRTTAGKGFRLDSIDYMYLINTDVLNSHSLTLYRLDYGNNVFPTSTTIGLTGSLATAVQTNPYLTNVTVTSPAFDNTTNSKYVLDIALNSTATCVYAFYGIMLRFTETIA